MRMGLVHYKAVHAAGRGQKTNTRAQDAINSIWGKVKRAADRYMHSYGGSSITFMSKCPAHITDLVQELLYHKFPCYRHGRSL